MPKTKKTADCSSEKGVNGKEMGVNEEIQGVNAPSIICLTGRMAIDMKRKKGIFSLRIMLIFYGENQDSGSRR
jgi:hypothetical protein